MSNAERELTDLKLEFVNFDPDIYDKLNESFLLK